MQWSPNQKGWRALLIRVALLTVLWLVVAFVFATELYLSSRGMPVEIPWRDAAGSAFHDWSPWMLLSPLAVILAGRFRFDHDGWKRSLAVHLLACCVFAVAYESLLVLVYPSPLSGGISIGMAGGGVSGPTIMPAFSVTHAEGELPLPPPDPAGLSKLLTLNSNIGGFEHGVFIASGTGPLPAPPDSNQVFVVSVAGHPPFTQPPRGFAGNFRVFPGLNRWTQFLHMTMFRTQFTIPIYWCIVCICWAMGHFQESGERQRRTLELEARLTEANLRALKMQLQPHFLFNTLNTIASLIYENPRAADDMIGSLSQFLRTTLEVSSENEISLKRELEFIDHYLEIQQTRFGDRLQIRREVEPDAVTALVPPLILQPLVENAIRYGIEPRETGGTVTLRASRAGDALLLEISDDGEGFRAGQLLKAGNGVGLSNTKARLQALYGDQHRFKQTENHPTGACVIIELPFRLPAAVIAGDLKSSAQARDAGNQPRYANQPEKSSNDLHATDGMVDTTAP